MLRQILLRFAQKKERKLFLAAEDGHVELVRTLLEAGVNPNASSEGGFTALMWAAARGHIDVVQALLGSGAESEIRTRNGKTARDIAVQEGQHNVVALLGKAGDQAV